jgi:hypothetical protein
MAHICNNCDSRDVYEYPAKEKSVENTTASGIAGDVQVLPKPTVIQPLQVHLVDASRLVQLETQVRALFLRVEDLEKYIAQGAGYVRPFTTEGGNIDGKV